MNLRAWPGIRSVLGGIIAIALISAAALRSAGAAEPAPAMWVVRDADSTIYLLGTFHLVKPDTEWRTEKIAAAFDASEEVWLEAGDLSDTAKIQALVLKHGFDRDRSLSDKLTPEARTRLDVVAKEAGLQPALFERMRPWLVALTLAVAPLKREGYSAAQGVDRVLEADARTAQKKLTAFETSEQQLMIFAGLSEEDELNFLMQSLSDAEMLQTMFDQMVEAWASGNIEALDRLVIDPMKQGAPGLYDAIFVRRNIAWSEQIDALMQGAGTSFVAVGVGHLIGTGSVPDLLAQRGFEVERY